MSKSENVDDDETFPEDIDELESENPVDLKTYWRNQVKAVARQFLYSCSVMMFPVLSETYKAVETEWGTYVKIYDEKNNLDRDASAHASDVILLNSALLVSVVAYVISAIMLYSIGRRYTIIIANLSHVAALLYSFFRDLKGSFPYNSGMVHHFIKELALVPYFIYLAEITSPSCRAFFLGLYYLLESITDEALHWNNTPIVHQRVLLICVILTSISSGIALLMRESPFRQMLKGNPEKAEETFLWLRAGNSDELEFNQMIAQVEDIREKQGIQIVLYLIGSFFLGVIFSCLIIICHFDPCVVLKAFLNNYFVPYDQPIQPYTTEYNEIHILIKSMNSYTLNDQHRRYGLLIFLFSCLAIPRKILFTFSLALSLLSITIITLKLVSFKAVVKYATYCSLTANLGVLPLSMIIPVELYPTPLREVGVTVTAILLRVWTVSFKTHAVKSKDNFFNAYKDKWVATTLSHVCYIGSFIAILFILLFMPETMGMNMYQLNELRLHLPFIHHGKTLAAETEDEAAEGLEEN